MKRAGKLASWLLVAVLLAGCAGGIIPTRLRVGGALDDIGKTFVSANQAYTRLCTAKALTQAECEKWAAFVPKFQSGYDQAYLAWMSGDGGTSTEIITRLKNQLLEFYIVLKTRGGV